MKILNKENSITVGSEDHDIYERLKFPLLHSLLSQPAQRADLWCVLVVKYSADLLRVERQNGKCCMFHFARVNVDWALDWLFSSTS